MKEALEVLAGAEFPKHIAKARREFGLWLEEKLNARLEEHGDFHKLKPVWLGSYSRHELSPKSDIDLLFAAENAEDEENVRQFVEKAFKSGLKLRSRTPENPSDWSQGVEPFDILALFSAKAASPEAEALLEAQEPKIAAHRPAILKAIREEREERRERQDSISNLLEPNLKFGAGGLRDIEQALSLRHVFRERFVGVDPYPFEILETIKEEFLFLRAHLHLLGSGDVLSAHDQLELANRLKVESPQVLMKFVQKELERASFYADWVVAYVSASKQAKAQAQKGLSTLSEAISKLRESSSVLNQFEIRLKVDDLARGLSEAEKGKLLHKAIHGDAPDAYFVSLYRSRLLEVLLPDLRKLRGLVQHDHYHRFTADAHVMQALREVERSKNRKGWLGPLQVLAKDLTAQEWWTLKLTALFHDLAKGRKGDHSTEGAALVNKYFDGWEYSENLRADVHWLVENHLILSTAAFRQNPQARATWQRLFERGVQGRRLILLALFTAIDIRATNPEAWTKWKAQLLLDLVESMTSPEAKGLQKHLDFASRNKIENAKAWLLAVDPLLLSGLPPSLLVEDLQDASKTQADLPPKAVRTKNGRVWVRFHKREDQKGLFLSFVKKLFGFGLSIQSSSISTIEGIGVYDWFCLRTEKSTRQISTWLALPSMAEVKIPEVEFQSIDLMSQDQDEWIFSFRGKDQRGLLLSAAQAIFEENLSIKWARAHTWGQQIDDIFAIQPFGEVENTLERLRKRFVT